MSKFKILLSISIILISACAPKVRVAKDFSGAISPSLALLPASHTSLAARERVALIQQELSSELRNKGFFVLDSKVVERTCSNPECPERQQLAKKHGIDTFAQVQVDSIARNNFLAGYYNSIRGLLRFSSKDDRELLRVEHAESERGGLLFNTGQIVQGIISQVKNSGDEAYGTLASKFVRTLVNQVPPPSSQSTTENGEFQISSLRTEKTPLGADKVCIRGTPNLSAYITLHRTRTNLREVTPGEYCGIYRLGDFLKDESQSRASVEVRSPFGDSTRKELVYEKGKVRLA